MVWTYTQSEPGLWTVGHFNPSGWWQTDSDHDNRDDARARVNYLNGGTGRPPEGPAIELVAVGNGPAGEALAAIYEAMNRHEWNSDLWDIVGPLVLQGTGQSSFEDYE